MSPAAHPAIENLDSALARAFAVRPAVGGFPVLAEVLRRAGVRKNLWELPSLQSLYLTELGPVVRQGTPLVTGTHDVPLFDEVALVRALREDQAGRTTFPQFLEAAWRAGVTHYEVDFLARAVTYVGVGERGAPASYVESYPAVDL